MQRLNADLSDIQLIMKNNISEVLQRGEKLESKPKIMFIMYFFLSNDSLRNFSSLLIKFYFIFISIADVQNMSTNLLAESKKFEKAAKTINLHVRSASF
jgi:hypothetical protein